jgi:hypothetical protein
MPIYNTLIDHVSCMRWSGQPGVEPFRIWGGQNWKKKNWGSKIEKINWEGETKNKKI